MNRSYTESFLELTKLIGQRKYEAIRETLFEVPPDFNWVRDVFEPVILKNHGENTMLELINEGWNKAIRLSYHEASTKANQLLNFLRKNQVVQGDRVFIMCGLHPELWLSYIAATKGGFILIPAASILNEDDISYRFDKVKPRVIISDKENCAKIEKALKTFASTPPVKLLIDGQQEGWYPFSVTENESIESSAAHTKSNDDLFWFFTSGTTGLPKVVAHTHTSYPLGHLSTAAWIGLKPGDRHYNISQPGWAKFAWSSVFAPLNMGATIIVYKPKGRFIATDHLNILEKFKVTTLCAPPTALRLLILEDLKKYRFALRECVSAGEPLNPEIIETWIKKTNIELRDGYGQTESTCMVCNLPGSDIKSGSMGHSSFLYDVIIANEEGHEMPANEEGQICVRMDPDKFNGIFRTYIGQQEKEKEVFRHGLYYTGDKAYKDRDGYIWFVGRNDDVIKSSDYRIGPFEVESVLLEIDDVVESAVVGSPHPIKGQEVKAFIVLKAGSMPDEDLAKSIFDYCYRNLAGYKIPRSIEFVDELPKTISGKIRRVELRAQEAFRKAKKDSSGHQYFFSK